MFECLFSIYMCVSLRVCESTSNDCCSLNLSYVCCLCNHVFCVSYHCHCVRFYSVNCSFLSVHASVSNAECNKYLLLIDHFFSYAQFFVSLRLSAGCLFSSDVYPGTAWHLLCANIHNCERVCEPSPNSMQWAAKVPKSMTLSPKRILVRSICLSNSILMCIHSS